MSHSSHGDSVTEARLINRTWITRGTLAADTERYLRHLECHRPSELPAVCDLAVKLAHLASDCQFDPKPAFYTALFSTSSPQERESFLHSHRHTRRCVEKWGASMARPHDHEQLLTLIYPTMAR